LTKHGATDRMPLMRHVAGWMLSFFLLVVFCVPPVAGCTFQEEPEIDLARLFDEGKKFEIEVHFGHWSLNLVKGLFEDRLLDELGDTISDEIVEEVKGRHPGVKSSVFEHSMAFDSGGATYGVEFRLYPGGREGPFSLGLSLDRTTMRLSVQGAATQKFQDGTSAEVEDAWAEINLHPFFTLLNFRWDFVPSWRITPYFILGLGVAALDGEVAYRYSGAYRWSGPSETVSGEDTKTIKEAEEEFAGEPTDFNIPNILPLLQLSLGVRAEIIPSLHLRVEAGIWDGVILRAGMAFLF